jgi:hypothetical protein
VLGDFKTRAEVLVEIDRKGAVLAKDRYFE